MEFVLLRFYYFAYLLLNNTPILREKRRDRAKWEALDWASVCIMTGRKKKFFLY